MSKDSSQTQTGAPRVERRSRSQQLIKKLVTTRTEMLSCYTRLASKKPLNRDPAVPILLQEFCQVMVDYTARAHFQLYRYIAEKRERRAAVIAVADEIYPRVVEITQAILDFNDKYDCGDHCSELDALEDDLSLLGELLADRIELEDRLIEALS